MQDRLGEPRRLLVHERRHGPRRRIRRRRRAEDAQAGLAAALRQPLRGALETLILGEPRRELLGGALGADLLLVLVVGVDEQARLELAQRRHQDEELGERLEVDLVGALELAEVGQHDVDDRHLDQLELVAQHEREQQVERARERVEVEIELENGSVHTGIVAIAPDARRPRTGEPPAAARRAVCASPGVCCAPEDAGGARAGASRSVRRINGGQTRIVRL